MTQSGRGPVRWSNPNDDYSSETAGLQRKRPWNLEQVRPVFFQSVKTGAGQMPWTANDAEKHTRKATTSELKELWAKVANESLERTSDEGRAVREANAVVARQARSG